MEKKAQKMDFFGGWKVLNQQWIRWIWQTQLCDKKTLKETMGTTNKKTPSLDPILLLLPTLLDLDYLDYTVFLWLNWLTLTQFCSYVWRKLKRYKPTFQAWNWRSSCSQIRQTSWFSPACGRFFRSRRVFVRWRRHCVQRKIVTPSKSLLLSEIIVILYN